jgi:hypothetical protein
MVGLVQRFRSLASTVLLAACSAKETAVSPAEGPLSGGFAVRIRGDDFIGHGPPLVYFGEQPAKGVVIASDRLIRVRSPEAGQVGIVDVNVVFPDGTTQEFPESFTYIGTNQIQLPEH